MEGVLPPVADAEIRFADPAYSAELLDVPLFLFPPIFLGRILLLKTV